jgi:hypothetical protein
MSFSGLINYILQGIQLHTQEYNYEYKMMISQWAGKLNFYLNMFMYFLPIKTVNFFITDILVLHHLLGIIS